MIHENIPAPPVVSEEEWRAERVTLLAEEKELTRQTDRVNAKRRRLPMVKVEKEYTLEGPEGHRTLARLFEGQRQLVVYHFMFDPSWDEGCMGCTGFIDAIGDLSMLGERQTRFVVVSRAPLAKLEAYKAKKGWDIAWYSSFAGDFNYDFHATLDIAKAPIEYNYRDLDEMRKTRGPEYNPEGEMPGLSVFFKIDDDVFHTYSTYQRGVEYLTDAYRILDVTPYGRQEDFEDSPPGWPQKPTYG